jgi:hypothetical protein
MAFEEGLIDLNPMRRAPLEPEGDGRERYLTHEEKKETAARAYGTTRAPARARHPRN